tara:strand:- start:48 stop:308 length:261 start_codon:yes stop_codon:yes gene_type:complete
MQVSASGTRNKMKLRNTLIAIGVGATSVAILSLLKVNQKLAVGSTAVVIVTGLIIALRNENDLNIKAKNYEYFFNRAQDKFEVGSY